MPTPALQTRPRTRYAYDELASMAKQLGPNAQLPTMVQLRDDLGVSMNTLHAALRELEQQQVLRSVHGVGIYVREPEQRALTGNIGLLGSVAFKAQQMPYYVHIAHGVQDAAKRHRQRVMLLGTFRDWDAATLAHVDGLLLSGYSDQAGRALRHALPPQFPCVSMLTVSAGLTSIVCDDYGGAQLAVSQLIRLGHRRIACLMHKETSVLRGGRCAGYRDALQAAGITPDSSWMRLVEILPGPKPAPQQWARDEMRDWLQGDWKKTGCTALLAQNDQAAIGAMQVLQEAGVKVPQQVSIVGFDGTELCDYTSPRLAAVQLPLEEVGRKAVEALKAQIENGVPEPQTTVLPTSWRAGDSIAPPR